MLQDIVIAVLLATIALVVGSAIGLIPSGNEPIEAPWRATVSMMIGLLLGVSAGFVWLQSSRNDKSFGWPVLLATFLAGGVFVVEVLYCLENNFESFYTLPITLSGPIALGIGLGAAVNATK